MKAVRFVQSYMTGCLYNPGDVAGFNDEVAASLIERGVAEAVEAEAKTEEPKAPAKK